MFTDMDSMPFQGERLQALREERRLSRQELARRAGLSRAYIYMLEGLTKADAARRPSYDVVLKLARALEIEPSEFGLTREAPGGPPPGANRQTPEALAEAALRFGIPNDELAELARFRFLGRRPQTATDWAHLWLAIRHSVGQRP
jgi:transcriptional regulator with XRE-family HTH domain